MSYKKLIIFLLILIPTVVLAVYSSFGGYLLYFTLFFYFLFCCFKRIYLGFGTKFNSNMYVARGTKAVAFNIIFIVVITLALLETMRIVLFYSLIWILPLGAVLGYILYKIITSEDNPWMKNLNTDVVKSI